MIVTWVAHSKSTAVRPGISWQYPLTGPWNSSTDPIPPCLLPAPPHPLLSSVGSQIRFRTPQSRTCTLACAWLALIQAARSNSYLESLVMQETCRAGSVPIKDRKEERVWSGFPRDPEHTHCLNRQCLGHLRTQERSSSAQAPDMPHSWRFTKRNCGAVFARHSPELQFLWLQGKLGQTKKFLLFR